MVARVQSWVGIRQAAGTRARTVDLATFALACLLGAVGLGSGWTSGFQTGGTYAYWVGLQTPGYYDQATRLGETKYIYLPPMAQILSPLGHLPWPVFNALWLIAAVLAYTWLLWPIGIRLRVPLIIAAGTMAADNLPWIYAIALAASVRYAAAWMVPLLTKVTPGVGVLWYAFRREWRSFALAIAATIVVAVVSFAVQPDVWFGWIELIRRNVDAGSLNGVAYNYMFVGFFPWRVIAAIALVLWGARSGRLWVLPISVVLAPPDIVLSTFGALAAIPRLRRDRVASQRARSGVVPEPQ